MVRFFFWIFLLFFIILKFLITHFERGKKKKFYVLRDFIFCTIFQHRFIIKSNKNLFHFIIYNQLLQI